MEIVYEEESFEFEAETAVDIVLVCEWNRRVAETVLLSQWTQWYE